MLPESNLKQSLDVGDGKFERESEDNNTELIQRINSVVTDKDYEPFK
jgi:hypothetical protein